MKIVEYIESKNHYEVLGEALMKNPQTREWQDCVIYRQYEAWDEETQTYRPIDTAEKLMFVREKLDFQRKFKEVEDD